MVTTITRETYFPPALLTAVGVAMVAWLFAGMVGETDRQLLTRLFDLLGAPEPAAVAVAQDGGRQVLVEFTALIIFSIASTWVSFRLGPIARIVVSSQIFVLSCLYLWVAWQWLKIAVHPLVCWLAILLGFLSGSALGRHYRWQRKAQSQYYELMLKNKELNTTKLLLVKQDEVERRLLAGDLHDQVLNDLKAIKQKLDGYLESPDEETAENIQGLLSQAMTEVREVMESLCPSALEKLGLIAAIKECAKRGSQRAGFRTHVKADIGKDELKAYSIVEQSLLYRLVQESITNIIKHAEARTVMVTLERDGGQLVIRVEDDGKGIDPGKLRPDSRGMRYQRQRADLIGAQIAWKPGENGRGTTVEIRLPLAVEQVS